MQILFRPIRVALCAFLTFVVLSGCQSTRPTPPPSDLQLLESAPLALTSDCIATGSFIVSFVVEPSGRTNSIRAGEAPTCVEQALSAWVQSFRYAPPRQATPATVEWMMVTARRGS